MKSAAVLVVALTVAVIASDRNEGARTIAVGARDGTAYGNWYSAGSPWNTRIPENVPIAANSSSLIKAMNERWCGTCIGPGFVSTPSAWIATSATPRVTVQINYPTCNARQLQVPIPANAQPTAYSDVDDPEPVMLVMDGETGVEWDFFKITRPGVTPKSSGPVCAATSNWAATVAYMHSPGWTGLGTGGGSTRGSGTWLGSGMIRKRDAQMAAGSTWDHALGFAYPGTLSSTYVWPATATDGNCNDANSCLPMGARIQMDPAVNCATWPTLAGEWQRQLCRTLQRYGMIVIDTGAGLITEQLSSVRPYIYPWEATGWNTLPLDITPHLRVIDWTKWGRRPSLLEQLRPYWQINGRQDRRRVVVTLSNDLVRTTTHLGLRICATPSGAKSRCRSLRPLKAGHQPLVTTFVFPRIPAKPLELSLLAAGKVQARRILR